MLITSFSSGEISKKLYGRIDLPIYSQAASRIENFEIIPTGGVTRRKGSKRLGNLKKECRIIPFIVNSALAYIFEIGSGYIRIWKDGQLLQSGSIPFEFISDGNISLYGNITHIREMQYAQTYDSMYMVHRSYKPLLLKWTGGNAFTLTTLTFTGNAGKIPFQKTGEYPGCINFFNGRLILAGTYNQPQRIWASKPFDFLNFTEFETLETKQTVLKNPKLKLFTATSTKDSSTLTTVSQDLTNIEEITAYFISGTGIPIGTKVASVTANTITMTNPAATSEADSTFTIQLWKSSEYPEAEDYEETILKNDITAQGNALQFEIASDKNDAIKWVASQTDLIIGTESSEWVIPRSLTAVSIQAILNSRHGSDDIQATVVGSAVLFFQQGKKAIREYFYQMDQQSYQAANIASLAEHILGESPAIDFDYTTMPHNTVLVTQDNGNAAQITYDKDTGTLGWCRISLGLGKVKSIAVAPNNQGNDDIYCVVQDGNTYRLELLGKNNKVFLDSYSPYVTGKEAEYTSEAITVITEGTEYIGYPYTSLIESLPVVKDAANSQKRIVSLLIRFFESGKPYVKTNVNPETPQDFTGEPFTGVSKISVPSSYDRDVQFCIYIDKPEACTILSVYAEVR